MTLCRCLDTTKRETLHGLALCSGIGGIELGLRIILPHYRTVGYVEREAYAAATLVARMADKALGPAPIWDNIESFDGRPWRGKVDIVTAGYPCQPFSVAGKRLGAADLRHLWPDVARIVSEVRPSICFFENVGRHLRSGFEPVRDDLLGMGYKVKAGLFTAAEVGAPHRRERLFILAYAENADRGTGEPKGEGEARIGRRLSGTYGAAMVDAQRSERGQGEPDGHDRHGTPREWEEEASWAGAPDEAMGDATVGGLEVGLCGRRPRGKTLEAPDGDSLPLFAPGPGDIDAWREVLEIDPALEPSLCRLDDELSSRVDRLRAYGNAVVPLCAAHAFRTLADAAGLT